LVSASSNQSSAPGRVLAIDLGAKRVGLAISDELRITIKPLKPIERRSWKRLLQAVTGIVIESEVRGLVIGLPLQLEGTEGDAAASARTIAEKFRRSLSIPVFLQDERLTTFAATESLKEAGRNRDDLAKQVDSEAAAIILRDFINQERT
jgi:putative Holliday junction resolvase